MRVEAEWLARPALRAVLDALGGEALVVGGAVRDTLLGRAVGDIDLATPLHPDEVVRRLERAGIKAAPTGIEHGTVTAVADGSPHEITTFRADVETDGRHAVVRFSHRLEEDAARRDFTINALYLRPDGTLVDPLGGLADLRAGRVRFIGEAEARIREDYLRILRFFRFSAWYADGIDPEGLAAVAALAEGLDGLARERVGAEMRKLLAAPDPAPAVAAMSASGVLARVLPGADPALLAPLVAGEEVCGAAPDWRIRLAALGGPEPTQALRLSRAESRFVADLRALLDSPRPPPVEGWAVGEELATAALLIRAAAASRVPSADEIEAVRRGEAATFPLTAADLIAAGIPEGPEIGRALKAAEAAWLASDFTLDKAALVREARDKGHIS